MSEMVERVARAFSDVCLSGCEHQGKADEMRACVDPPCYCREMARVAIAAMHDPTDAMLQGACSKHKVGEDDCSRMDTRRLIWSRMIAAALE